MTETFKKQPPLHREDYRYTYFHYAMVLEKVEEPSKNPFTPADQYYDAGDVSCSEICL